METESFAIYYDVRARMHSDRLVYGATSNNSMHHRHWKSYQLRTINKVVDDNEHLRVSKPIYSCIKCILLISQDENVSLSELKQIRKKRRKAIYYD